MWVSFLMTGLELKSSNRGAPVHRHKKNAGRSLDFKSYVVSSGRLEKVIATFLQKGKGGSSLRAIC